MNQLISGFLLAFFVLLNSCGQVKENYQNSSKSNIMTSKSNNPYYSRTDSNKLNVSNEEWKKILNPTLYAVAREAATERAFTGTMWNSEIKGTYYCAVCGNNLFKSNQKFTSSCGWPSFFEQENKNSIWFKPDNSHGMQRTEALCGRCDSHLGHLFDDGPEPTGKRYCMNAISLDFIPDEVVNNSQNNETIVLGGGCFWCVEAIYENLNGVDGVISGYAGGTIENPTYEQVCTGITGAAEVIKISYNTKITSLEEILKIFFTVHDPTTLNRQGADVGTQYRSVIFYKNEKEKEIAQTIINDLNKFVFANKITTTLEPLVKFYKAENYHQNYFEQNRNKPYCQMVIQPKVEKFELYFKDKIKVKK